MSRAEISDLTSLGEEAEIDCLLTLVARNYADRKGKTFRISGEGYAFVKKCLGEAADRPMEPAPDTYDD